VATFYANAADFYSQQLKSLFEDYIDIQKFSFSDLSIENGINCDLVLIPSDSTYESVKQYVKNNSPTIVANRTLSKDGFNKIINLPPGTKAMLANVGADMAMETISLIHQLGIHHLELIPVYPGMNIIPDLDIAITPGELQCVPDDIHEIIDIGDRVLDISTIMDITMELGIADLLQKQHIRNYFNEIMPINIGLDKIVGKTNKLESQLDILLHILDEGVIGVNTKGIIYSYNESAERILGYKKEEIIGTKAARYLPQVPFEYVLNTSQPIKEALLKIGSYDIVVTIAPIIHSLTLYGAVAIIKKFSDVENKQHKLRAQLIGKGHVAKYSFDDILGKSESINRCKDIAKRMAKSDSSILITGKSGTGKELFAQAIHNYSLRKDYQFVAVNCAAFPESLLESELFGYEEGAFTGARKGGKLGLFELSHRGTLFLDEIGEMPISLQTRLLRVLQEREVMRIGGDHVINVDVRVIAATNRNLQELVNKGQFRQDLYFRLNVLPLNIPPLTERKEDILFIVEELKKYFHANFDLTPGAISMFLQHDWEGNVRQLKNYIEYLTNLRKKTIDIEDLPFSYTPYTPSEKLTEDEKVLVDAFIQSVIHYTDKYTFVLEELEKNYFAKKRCGRKTLADAAAQQGIFLTEQEIRKILTILESFLMVETSIGRGGTKISSFGLKALRYFRKKINQFV